MTHHTNRELEILKDPSVTYWVKERVMELGKRDPVQSVRDLELLLELQKQRLNSIDPAFASAE